jgi:D-beta-D-heptose 7-phosphate kinase/D-beta-D-heptose 1-phosphate adenosyltransferase
MDFLVQKSSLKILLIGESCLDEYRYGVCKRLSPEAPIPVFSFNSVTSKVGMAANVLQNLHSFNLNVDFLSNDYNKIIKRRFIDEKSKHQLLREDIEEYILPLDIKEDLDYDFIIISDYDKGLISDEFISNIVNKYDGNIFVDTKRKNISFYENCFIKINKNELFENFLFPKNSKIIITDGENGSIYNENKYPAPKVNVFDVVGAGDVFIACFSVSYYITKDIDFSIIFANKMASESVKHIGIYKINQQDIYGVINEIRS